MRILLATQTSYSPPRGGATRCNRYWLEELSLRGHECRAIARTAAEASPLRKSLLLSEMLADGVRTSNSVSRLQVSASLVRGVSVFSVSDPGHIRGYLEGQIEEFSPDLVLVSSEDWGQSLLETALRCYPGNKVLYLAHTPQLFPFGSASLAPNLHGCELVKQAAGVLTIGHSTAQYVLDSVGIKSSVIHPQIYGQGPFATYGNISEGLVTIVNPCAVKGISLFLALVRNFPDCQFGALPGWGTSSADLRALSEHSNIQVLPPCHDIDEVMSKTRVLVVPSLWLEGFGLVVIEAMLRGIPVLASDFGGLREAKLGTDFLLPVTPICQYQSRFDDNGLPIPILPNQDLSSWYQALDKLLLEEDFYRKLAHTSKIISTRFVSTLNFSLFENFIKAVAGI